MEAQVPLRREPDPSTGSPSLLFGGWERFKVGHKGLETKGMLSQECLSGAVWSLEVESLFYHSKEVINGGAMRLGDGVCRALPPVSCIASGPGSGWAGAGPHDSPGGQCWVVAPCGPAQLQEGAVLPSAGLALRGPRATAGCSGTPTVPNCGRPRLSELQVTRTVDVSGRSRGSFALFWFCLGGGYSINTNP